MKKLFALLGILAISSTVFLPQAQATMVEDLTSSVTEVSSPMLSKDKYNVVFTIDEQGSGADLSFTLDAKDYMVKLSDSYYVDLMVCAVGDVLNKEPSTLDKGLLKSIERTAYEYFFEMDKEGIDCIKDAEGVYRPVYSVTSHGYDVRLMVGGISETTSIFIKPTNGGEKQTLLFADGFTIDLASCALLHEQNVTFKELDANILFAVSDVLTEYGGGVSEEGDYYYSLRGTTKEDCRKNSKGAYVFVAHVEAGDYEAERYEDYAEYPKLLTHYTITHGKNISYEYSVVVDGYTGAHVELCAAEDVLHATLQDMDEDLRTVIADISYTNPIVLKRSGTLFFNDCKKNSDGVYVDVPTTKEKISEGIRILEQQIGDTEKVLKQLKQAKYREAGSYVSGKSRMDQVKADLADAQKLYKDRDYESALTYLEYGAAGLVEIESLKVNEDAYMLHDEVSTKLNALYMSNDYYKHLEKIDAIQEKFDKATELYMDGQYEKLIEVETAILKELNKI